MIQSQVRSRIATELDAITDANHTGAGCLQQSWRSCHLRARVSSVDRLACEVECLTLTFPQQTETRRLVQIAEKIATRLGYLEERLVVLEQDLARPLVQLRSEQPRRDEDTISYFEVLVRPNEIELVRFRKSPNQPRVPVAAIFTRDTFGRVCSDLVEIADGTQATPPRRP